MDPGVVARELGVSARAVEAGPGFPRAYVERIRAAAGALSPFVPSDDEIDGAVRALRSGAAADPVVTVVAMGLRGVGQRLVKRLVHWDLDFLSARVGEIGRAAARLGQAVAQRLERIEGRQVAGRDALHTEVAELRARVAELEVRLGGGLQGDASGPRSSR